MRKLLPALGAVLLLLCVYFTFFHNGNQAGEVDISIKNSPTSYLFDISFADRLTPEVTSYVDSCAGKLQKEKAQMRIKISEGNLTIQADKKANSEAALDQIKNMCHGIGDYIFQF